MAKRKTDYLRGLSRAAYNALQRYNRLARQDGMKALSPGAVKRFAREQGVSAYEFIRKAEETNIAPRVSKKEEAMIRRLRAIEKRAGKVPTSTAAIRRSIAAAKAKKPRKGMKRKKAKDVLAQLEIKSFDVIDPSSVKWLATLARSVEATQTADTIEKFLDGHLYVKGKGMLISSFNLVKDAIYDFKARVNREEFASAIEKYEADLAIASMAKDGFIDVSLKFKNWQAK